MKKNEKYFLHPQHEWQKRYEALRASFVERLSADVVADRFGYSPGYINLLRHQFTHGLIDFSEPIPEGKSSRYRVTADLREKICGFREKECSAGEIAEILSNDGTEISVRTIERVLEEEGYSKLPRRFFRKTGITVTGAEVPEPSHRIGLANADFSFETDAAGLFLFLPFLERLGITDLVNGSKLPGSKVIPNISYFLSMLAVKLTGTERYAHVGKHSFDRGVGLFGGLNALPKVTALSTYSYSLDHKHLLRFQENFIEKADKLRLLTGNFINLDFHTIPHNGEESVLEQHWAGARGKCMKGALTLFAQDADSKIILYTDADIMRNEQDEQVERFMKFWKKIRRNSKPTLVFDSKFTTYEHLARLEEQNVKFITLRRRGKNLVESIDKIPAEEWKRIHIPHPKRKYPNPLTNESMVKIRGYEKELRQVILKGTGREEPTFLISNDFDIPTDSLVGHYARRWRVENGIAEAVKFFNLNSLSSPMLVKVGFDVVLTMVADTLYSMFAQKLRGYEHCDASKIYRDFIRGSGIVQVKDGQIAVKIRKRAHNPILRNIAWNRLPTTISWLDNTKLSFEFR